MRTIHWAALAGVVAATGAGAAPLVSHRFATVDDTQTKGAAIDYGYGPGVKKPTARPLARSLAVTTALSSVPNGGAQAATMGAFGPTIPWPIIPIHVGLLPDGRLMSFGSNPDGSQTGQFVYDVWNPALGTDTTSHTVLPNTTNTDIFCGGLSVTWTTGEALTTGGDLTVNGVRNYSNNATTIFSPKTNTIRTGPKMQYPRWYNSIVALPDEQMLALGGRTSPTASATTPEVYSPWTGWRTLTGATSAAAFADNTYPRAWTAPGGRVYFIAPSGAQYYFNTAGAGSITQAYGLLPQGWITLPTVMYAPGKLLSVRADTVTDVIDINGATPTFTPTGSIDQNRVWSSATVLADGKVLVNGGSLVDLQLSGAAYTTQIWDPATGRWTTGASAARARLYHGNAILLPDATVLTGGGGAPGPVSNLNAEVYYPPYLFNADGSGTPAARPTLVAAPAVFTWGKPMVLQAGAGNAISRVTIVRMGAATHSTNLDQRFMDLPFTQAGTSLSAILPTDWSVLLPGNWMVFVWQNGVPSLSKTMLVPS